MGSLKQAIADKTNTLASSKYVNADSTKQNAYTTKVTNAEHIISGTPTVVTTPSEVTAAANQVNSAKQELNGDERLREAKQNANTAIDALTQLNTPQKAKLKEQVGQANRLEDVQTVQTNGQALNNAMKGLRDSIANEQQSKQVKTIQTQVRITNQHIIALCQMRKVSLIKLTIRLWMLVRLPKLQHK